MFCQRVSVNIRSREMTSVFAPGMVALWCLYYIVTLVKEIKTKEAEQYVCGCLTTDFDCIATVDVLRYKTKIPSPYITLLVCTLG